MASYRRLDGEMLESLKQQLKDLDQIKLISPEDLAIVSLKNSLKRQIADLEREQDSAITAMAAD